MYKKLFWIVLCVLGLIAPHAYGSDGDNLIEPLDLTSQVGTSVLPVANGGTGLSTPLSNDRLIWSTAGGIAETGATWSESTNDFSITKGGTTFGTTLFSKSTDGTTQSIIRNTDSSLASETYLLELQQTANADAQGDFIKCSDDYGGTPLTVFNVEYDGRTRIGDVTQLVAPTWYATAGKADEGLMFEAYGISSSDATVLPLMNIQNDWSYNPASLTSYLGTGLFYTKKAVDTGNSEVSNVYFLMDQDGNGQASAISLHSRVSKNTYGGAYASWFSSQRINTASDGHVNVCVEVNSRDLSKDTGFKEDKVSPLSAGIWNSHSPYTADFVENGDFTTDTGWTKGTGWTISGGDASCDGSQVATSNLAQAEATHDNYCYIITFTVSNYSAGSVTPYIATDAGRAVSANGTYVQLITATADGTTGYIFVANSTFVGEIDDVSITYSNQPQTFGYALNGRSDVHSGVYNGLWFNHTAIQQNGVGINFTNTYDTDMGPLHNIKFYGYYGDSYASTDIDIVTFDGVATWANITSDVEADDSSYANNFLTDNNDVVFIGSTYLFDAIRYAKLGASDYAVGAGPVIIYYYDGIDFTQEVGGIATERVAGQTDGVDNVKDTEIIERVIDDETMTGIVYTAVADGGNTGAATCTSSGTLSTDYALDFKIEIDTNGTPDTFKWSQDGGLTWVYTKVAITAGLQTLGDGVKITFDSTTTAHLGDIWTFKAGDCFAQNGTMRFAIPQQWAIGADSYNANLDSDKYYIAIMTTTSPSTDPDADLLVPFDGGYGAHIYAADSSVGLTVRSEADVVFHVGKNRGGQVFIGDNSTTLSSSGYLWLGPATGANLSLDTNEIQARNNGVAVALLLNAHGGTVVIGDQTAGIDLYGSSIDIGDGVATADLWVDFDTGGQDGRITWDEDPGEFDFDADLHVGGDVKLGDASAILDHHASYTLLQVGDQASIFGLTAASGSGDLNIGNNAYYDETTDNRYEYINTGYATRYIQTDNYHLFSTAPSGTTNGAITFVNPLMIQASTVTVAGVLDVHDQEDGGASSGPIIKKTYQAGETYSGTEAALLVKAYDKDATVTHGSGEHAGLALFFKPLSRSGAGGENMLMTLHQHSSGTQTLTAGLMMYPKAADAAFAVRASTLSYGLDFADRSNTVITTADFRGHEGEIIFNNPDGNWDFGDANIIIHSPTPNGNLVGGLILGNGTAASAAVTDGIQIYAVDCSDSKSTLGLYTEQAVEAGAMTPSHKLKVRINGVEYYMSLDAV